MVDEHDHEEHEINNTISRNIFVSILANILYLATRLMIPPLIIHHVPLREYGIWSYCFVLITYISTTVSGVNNVYIRYITVFLAKHEMDKINRLVSTGVVTVSTLCAVLLGIAWVTLPYVFPLMNIPLDLYQMAFVLMFGTLAIHVGEMTIGVFNNVLQSMQKIVLERTIWTLSFILETILIVFFLWKGFGIYSLLIAYVIRTAAALLTYAVVCFKQLPGLDIGWKHFDLKMTKLFYHFGGIIQLSTIFAVINRSTERILGGSFIDVTATALYDLGEKFPIMATSISGTVNQVLLPSTAHLHAKERKEHLRQVYVKSSRLINGLTGYLMGFLAAFAVPLITCWLGTKETFSVAASILAIFSPAYQMDVLTGPASAIYRSTENPSRELVYNAGRFFLVVVAISFLFWSFGASFTTINWGVASMMVLSSLIYISLANRFMLVSQLEYVKEVILPGFVPYAIGFLLFWLSRGWYESITTDRWRILPYLMIMLAVYSIATPLFLYFFLLHEHEKKYLSQRFFSR